MATLEVEQQELLFDLVETHRQVPSRGAAAVAWPDQRQQRGLAIGMIAVGPR